MYSRICWYLFKRFVTRQAHIRGEVPVGCIFVYNDNIIATGSNEVNETKNATRHAEIIAIDKVIKHCELNKTNFSDVFKETTVYVTVEPCIMCASALRNLELKHVVYGCANERFGGCESVIDVTKNPAASDKSPLQCTAGILAENAVELLKSFYKGENPNAPVPMSKVNR